MIVKEIPRSFSTISVVNLKKFFFDLVKEILVYDDEIVIKYNTPTTISPDESQGFSFYHKTLKFAYKVRQRRDMKKFEIKVEIRV